MDYALEAIYESGVLKPLKPLSLPEHQRVTITIHWAPGESPEAELQAWQQVYAGLSDQEIQDIESIVLDRSNFFSERK